MKPFLDENFLLETKTAQTLYHNFARECPIIDYHCHLPPDEIASNHQFANLTEVWLKGDHYKWRAMRTLGVDEDLITGEASDFDKFSAWAQCVPYTLRNPLYHWTHLELRRYFNIDDILDKSTAKKTFDVATALLQESNHRVHGLLKKMNVKVICTTDDPVDDLQHHQAIATSDFGITVLPAFRPDQCLAIQDEEGFGKYLQKLGDSAGIYIATLEDLYAALQNRMLYFAEHGCSLSDHGLEKIYADDFSDDQADEILQRRLKRLPVSQDEMYIYKSAVLHFLGTKYHEYGWVQQFHIGALRNNNSRMEKKLGPNTGFDSIGDWRQASSLAKFLNRLDQQDQLAKTILYNLNPADNATLASMIGNFNDGSARGKIQFGSGWWFLDQKDGMEDQMNTLSNMGLLSCFVGMLTDSRSFLSYPRHEYFRRILCNLFGRDIENGLLPADIDWTGKIITDICYQNACDYFDFSKK